MKSNFIKKLVENSCRTILLFSTIISIQAMEKSAVNEKRKLKVACIQTQFDIWYDSKAPGNWDLNKIEAQRQDQLNKTFAFMEQAAAAGANFIVTIEAVNTGVNQSDQRYDYKKYSCSTVGDAIFQRFANFAIKHKVYVVAGLYTCRDGKAYNSAVLFGCDGKVIGIYDKTHLPPGEDRYITPGTAIEPFDTEFGKIGLLICWDMEYPECARALALKGADMLVCPTWGGNKLTSTCRAYENQIPVVFAMGVAPEGKIWDSCSPSLIIDHEGKIIVEAPREPGFIVADVNIGFEAQPGDKGGALFGMKSWRQLRASERRPELYGVIASEKPPLYNRYDTMKPTYTKEDYWRR